MPIGNRVFLRRNLPPADLLEAFCKIPAANVADAMQRLCALHTRIHLISSPSLPVMCGYALTVKTHGSDNLLLHKALDEAGENDVIVVSNEGGNNRAIMGEIMARYAFDFKKIRGIVADAPIRDISILSKMNAFLYATGSTPGGPFKQGPGEMNVPIACGDISISPGDIIIGDKDGVIVVPKQDAFAILSKAQQVQIFDEEKTTKSSQGLVDRSWVMRTLEHIQCEIINAAYER